MATTKIEWTTGNDGTPGKTWNPITGCTHAGTPGCDNCYAKRMAKRLRGRFGYSARNPFGVTCHWDRLHEPQQWKKPRRIFVCSMGDFWHPDVQPKDRATVIRATNLVPQHTYIFLTKRPERFDNGDRWLGMPNFWFGVTAENQAAADARIPLLLNIPAAVRFISVEPMLGPVDTQVSRCRSTCDGNRCTKRIGHKGHHFALTPTAGWEPGVEPMHIDWVIVGCESGPGRRPCKPEWVRSLVTQCRATKVPVFVKQLDLDGRVSKDMDEWPTDLRIREYPSKSTKAGGE